ncbi:heavy-metal resistance protein [Yoonia maritima]|uniref:Heavy-metal resistance protein n=1 Tax=Yoonia maritima TaxID=1435347 RepID=A0A2T0W3S1_9RHOB|nr:periplasmic heavy metal sensor [Yoonia maritima]PRY79657.1 heavy-metal resistance protein [Yoonia maritima]
MADEQAKNGRTVRIVLVASLALNLAVAGLAIGSLASGRIGDGPPRSFDLGLGPISRALESEDRRQVAIALRRSRPMADFDVRGQIAKMVLTLRADPFDPDALRILMAEQSQHTEQLQHNAHNVLINHFTTMSVDERNAFADRLVAELSHVRERGNRGDRDGRKSRD